MKKLYNKVNKEELKQKLLTSDEKRVTLSFYQYAHIADVAAFRNELYLTLKEVNVFGRIYVSKEGVNGQISVAEENFESFKERLYTFDFLKNIRLNIA